MNAIRLSIGMPGAGDAGRSRPGDRPFRLLVTAGYSHVIAGSGAQRFGAPSEAEVLH